MRHFSLSAIGRDRPGIVAAITRDLLAHGVNIEDSQMAILRGHFTMMLVVAVPDELDLQALAADLEGTGKGLGLEALSLSEIADLEAEGIQVPSHIVSVYGADHPGIVHAIASALAERDVNITDLNTRLLGDDDGLPLSVLVLEVAPPAELGAEELRQLLEAVGAEQGVEVAVRELEHEHV